MKKYSGQAIAIVLVLLIVGSLIGFALYARFARESERAVDERAASEADNLVETVAGLLNSTSYDSLETYAESELCGGEGLSAGTFCTSDVMTVEGLKEFFVDLGLDADLELTELFNPFMEYGDDYCSGEVRMRYGAEGDQIILGQDEVYSVYFNKVADWGTCQPSFNVSRIGSALGFVMSSFYGDVDGDSKVTEYKSYELEDIRGFNYQDSDSNWELFNSGDALTFSAIGPYFTSKGGYPLLETRFKSLGGESGLTWSFGGCDKVESDFLIFEVGATCGDNSVEKGFIMPGEIFAPPIFDYVLFNGQGDLVPERIQ